MQSVSGKSIRKVTHGIRATQHAHLQGELETKIPECSYAFRKDKGRGGQCSNIEASERGFL